jgi:hypothetical protein
MAIDPTKADAKDMMYELHKHFKKASHSSSVIRSTNPTLQKLKQFL